MKDMDIELERITDEFLYFLEDNGDEVDNTLISFTLDLIEKAYRDGYIAGAKELDKENKRAKTLLKATYDLLKKCDDSYHVKDVLGEKVMYDNAECDGICLMEDIESFLTEE